MKKITIGIIGLAIIAIVLSGCIEDMPVQQPSTQSVEQNTVENNQQTLISNQPIPTITKSLERQNLIDRAKVLNDDSKVFYVYLISYGKVMAFYTARGKVSSLNSYLNSGERIVASDECLRRGYEGSSTSCYNVIDTPDIDGSYGQNANGVFFFTTDGAYVEWYGEYMASDYPLKLSTPPELVRQIQ